MHRHKVKIRLFQIGIFLSLLFYGYSNLNKPLSYWRDEELIVVISTNTTLSDEEFSKELAQKFADYLHVPLKILLVPADQLDNTLKKHLAHFSATGFRLDEKNSALLFGPGYLTVHEQVAYNLNHPAPLGIEDLLGKRVAVVAGSNNEKSLIELKKTLPALKWESRKGQTVEDLLTEISQEKLDYTIANHEQIEQMINYNQHLAAAFDTGKPSKLAWAFPAKADNELIAATERFFSEITNNGEMDELLDRYYGHNDRLAPLDAAEFVKQTATRLPKYRALFEEAGRTINEDWRLIAAMAYQESHWDPLATSFTNVRGMMMLTESTADSMNVKNRINARESILGGSRYLALIKKQLPSRIDEPERTWMALSAYNQGQGHLEDARNLTEREGGNPNSWIEVKKWLPSLGKPQYFKKLKYGYARGGEAVIFVENIRAYYDLLSRLVEESEKTAPQTYNYQLVSTRTTPAFSLHPQRTTKLASTEDPAASPYRLSK